MSRVQNSPSRGMSRALLLLLPLSLATLTGSGTPQGMLANEELAPLRVLHTSPVGDVARLASIDVVFSEPIVPLGDRKRAKETIPLIIDPPVRGSGSWIGTRAWTFVPESEPSPGTRLVCRIPAGVESMEGHTLQTDHTWEIDIDRPRLLLSIPGNDKVIAPDATLYLLFNVPPADEALSAVRVDGPTGSVPLVRVSPDSSAIAELAHPQPDERIADRILAVKPVDPLAHGSGYTLSIARSLRFIGTDLTLAEDAKIGFETFGAPRFRSVGAQGSSIELTLQGPVSPEALDGCLETMPPIPNRSIQPHSGTSFQIEGEIPRGVAYEIRLRAGLTSLLGARLETDQITTVHTPHIASELSISPSEGYLPRVPGLTIRLIAANLDSVMIYGRWIAPDRVPDALDLDKDRESKARLPLVAVWREPGLSPDSLKVIDIPVARFGERQGPGAALEIQATGQRLFPDAGQSPELRDRAFLQITDLGLSSFIGVDSGTIWATRLSSGEGVPAAEIQIRRSDQPLPLWTGQTDQTGLVTTPGFTDLKRPADILLLAQVRKGDDAAWIRLDRWEDFVDGRVQLESDPRSRAHIETDRPLYRPGETVHWTVFVRRSGRNGIEPSDLGGIGYVVRGGFEGKEIDRGRIDLVPPGNGSAELTLPLDAPTGSISIELTERADGVGEPFASRGVQVEEFRLPRFEAHLDPPRNPAISGSATEVEGRFSYLGGGPLAHAPIRWTLQRRSLWSRPEGYFDFSFRDERIVREMHTGSRLVRIQGGEEHLDEEGRIELRILPSLEGLGEDAEYLLEMGARDLTDRSAYDVIAFPAFRAAVRIGARAVNLTATKDRALEFTSVVLDTSGTPVEGLPVRWAIERRDWKTVRIRRIGGIFGYENVPCDTLLQSGKAESSLEPMHFRWIPPSPGQYSFRVEVTDSEGRMTSARDDVWVSGTAPATWWRDDHGWLDLKPDREEYVTGDTAMVLIPAPAIETEGLLLVLDGGIRSVRRLHAMQGSPRIPVPLIDAAPPNTWIEAILVGASSVPDGPSALRRLPYYGYGRVGLEIDDSPWRLDVGVETPKERYQPGETVDVEITLHDAQGRPTAGTATIAVVDDAIYELVGTDDSDPLRSLLPRRWDGIDYSELRRDLHLPVDLEKGDASPGGGAEGEGAGRGVRKQFLPTVYWQPLVPIGADGRGTVQFRLADSVTRYRIRVVASAGSDHFGAGESKIDVRKPIQIEWNAPRFAREGDEIEIAAVVRSDLEQDAKLELRAEVEGGKIVGRDSHKLKVKAGESERREFRLENPGPEGITLRLTASGEELSDAVEVTIPTDRPFLWDQSFQGGTADPLIRSTVTPAPSANTAMGGLRVIVSSSMLSGFDTALDYVVDYPYGCLEQLSSSLLGLANRQRIVRYLEIREGTAAADREAKIATILSEIARCSDSWNIRAWPSPDSHAADDYTVGYTLLALAQAKRNGLSVPEALLTRFAKDVMHRLDRLWNPPRPDDEASIRRLLRDGPWLLYALSEIDRAGVTGAPTARIGDMEALFSRRADADVESKIVLGLALANARLRSDAAALRDTWSSLSRALLQELKQTAVQRTGRHVWISPSSHGWGEGLGSDERATALYLRLLAQIDPADADVPGVIGWLSANQTRAYGGWNNNHVTALTLQMLASTLIEVEGPRSQVSGTLSIGGVFENFLFNGGAAGELRKFAAMSDLTRDGVILPLIQLRLEADGRRPVYYTATLDEAFPALEATAREEGLILDRTYVDTAGRELDQEIPLGDPFYVRLSLVVSRDARALVVEDPLPAGIEVLNLRFQNTPRVSMSHRPDREEEAGRLWIVHRELRDRRVRLYAENVKAGLYRVYYPVLATTGGSYRTPGARAEMMYSPEIYGTSSPTEVRIQRKR